MAQVKTHTGVKFSQMQTSKPPIQNAHLHAPVSPEKNCGFQQANSSHTQLTKQSFGAIQHHLSV